MLLSKHMENEIKTPDTTSDNIAKLPATKADTLHTIAKLALAVFIISLCLLALLGIVNIWGGFSSDIFAKLEGTLGILTGATFFLNIGIRLFAGRKK